MAVMAFAAKVAMLLLILISLLAAITMAARPMEGSAGWLETAPVRMVIQMLDSESNRKSHCC
ncbi:hypothetical protein GQ55_7G103300 [Panicum hallii var. hallii]|uniref:Uncharacterized protein n=1 Tax=Panicum hallii var. hallii TaxID=1504633 RepID=A0A2T7CTN3_9POAL|nr:hypothetical protein GQ55_7G103300 [Panicum hallii var. hallii]